MEIPKTISVKLDGNKTADLQVEERVFSDLSYGQYESGWTCFDLNTDTEYFVSESGDVWKQPENKMVGVAPKIVQRMTEMEIRWEKHYIE
jgi:hypothetical protein